MINGEYMTLRQAAAYMGVSRQQFYTWRHTHSIKSYRRAMSTGKERKGRPLVYVKKSDIDEMCDTFIELPSKKTQEA